jgi:hypothetical protein
MHQTAIDEAASVLANGLRRRSLSGRSAAPWSETERSDAGELLDCAFGIRCSVALCEATASAAAVAPAGMSMVQ